VSAVQKAVEFELFYLIYQTLVKWCVSFKTRLWQYWGKIRFDCIMGKSCV